MGHGGFGYLENDWMVQTADPLPAFSAAIQFLFEHNLLWVTYLIQSFCVWIYAFFSFRMVNVIWNNRDVQSQWLFYVFFFILHSPALFFDLHWGLSFQYLIIQYLQPSSFSVLYIPTLYFFFRRKYLLSVVLMLIPALFHGIYILVGSALFFACFSYFFVKEKPSRPIIIASIVYSIIALLILIFNFMSFQSDTGELSEQANRIIATERIPHHTSVYSIFRFDLIIKMIFLLSAIFWVRKPLPKWILQVLALLLIPAILSTFLLQNATISLTTPWRFSVVLIPLGFIFFSTKLSEWINEKLGKSKIIPIISITACLFISGLGIHWTALEFKKKIEGSEMLSWINSRQGQFYEATFLVHPVTKYAESFRLTTGIPIYVNWKTHPYDNAEVLEWFNRLQTAKHFYTREATSTEREDILKETNISHVVVRNDEEIAINGIKVYEDEVFQIIERAN